MSSATTSPSRRRPALSAAALARSALAALLSGDVQTRAAELIVVVSADAGRLLADLGGEVHEAGELARQLARAEARGTHERLRERLVGTGRILVHAADRIAPPHLQRTIATLLDEAAARGAVACVSLSVPPPAAGLDPALESRLSAGLVVRTAGGPPAAAPTLRTSIDAVIRATARTQGIPIDRLVGHDRQRTTVRGRGLAMHVARACTGMSLGAIGRHFGGREHTTVMRGIRAIESQLGSDPGLAADMRAIVAALAAGRSSTSRSSAADVDCVSAKRSRGSC